MLTNTNQIKRLLYSFVIAFIFWFFIKSEDTYSVTTSIPLVARNLQEQKTYKEEVPESIIVTLKGSGRAFIWLRFFDNFYEDYKAVIDLSSIADEYNFELDQYYKNNPEKIVFRLNNSITKQKQVINSSDIITQLNQSFLHLIKTPTSKFFNKKGFSVDTSLNGEERAIVVTGEMEKVFPLDLFPMQLIKACMIEDIEKMEALGIYEVVPEDFGLIDYANTSKLEAQEIIKQGIELMINEVG